MWRRVLPLVCLLASFCAGWVAFHPGWRKALPLVDRASGSFERVAETLSSRDLLANASPQERIGWLLEVCRQPRSLARDHALYEAIQKMQPGDFLAAFADLPALAAEMERMDGALRPAVVEAAIARWLDVDESGALRWLSATRIIMDTESLQLPNVSSRDIEPAFRVLSQRKPEWMWDEARKLGSYTQRPQAMKTALAEAVKTDRLKARQMLDSLEGTPDWEPAYIGYIRGLAQVNATQAATVWLERPVARDWWTDLPSEIIFAAAQQDPSTVPGLLSRFGAENRSSYTMAAYNALEQKPNFDALTWLQDRVAADPELLIQQQQSGFPYLTTAMVERDPLRTIEWIKSLGGEQEEKLLPRALAAWSRTDPDGLLQWLTQQPAEALPTNLHGIEEGAAGDPAGFTAWARTLPPGEGRNRVQLAMAEQLVRTGHVSEGLQILPQDLSSPASIRATMLLAERAASLDTAAATREITAMPEGSVRAHSASGLVAFWVQRNPFEAAQWVQGLAAGVTRDWGTSAMARAVAGVHPEAAGEWVSQISDARVRNEAASDVFRSWQRRDSHAARAWLTNFASMDDQAKERLLSSRR